MTLRQLLVRYNWLNIEATLLQEYPFCKKQLSNYETVYQSLLLLEEADTDLQIQLQTRPDEPDNQTTVEIFGRKRNPPVAEARLMLPYSLHFMPWAEWLAMPVSLRSLAHFSEVEIVTHCMVEMTRKGFDEATIQAKARHLCTAMDERQITGNGASLNSPALLKQLSPGDKWL